jgi:hypothetical protein
MRPWYCEFKSSIRIDTLVDACEEADAMERNQYEWRDGQKVLYLSHNQAGSTDFVVCKI